MGEFEKARIEKALKSLSNENLCTILESTGLSVENCWKPNISNTDHFILLRKVSSRIDELSQEHWKRQTEQ
jgi:hypothetical protein